MALVIEDLHAADTASLLLLRFLAGQVSDSHILVLATYRDVELTPDHPLTPALSELAREPNTRHLVIAGLGEADVAKFIETAAHVAPQGQLVSMLHRETNGNPLFLGEAVRLLAAEGRLDEMADPASLRIAVPAGIRAVIGRRVDHLGETCQQALTLGSVLGPEFTSEVLRRLAELSADQLLDVVDEVVQAGLLVEVPGALGRFRFSHGLVRETLYEGCLRLGGSGCTGGRGRSWRSCTDRTRNRTSRSWPTTSSRPPEEGTRRRRRTTPAEPATRPPARLRTRRRPICTGWRSRPSTRRPPRTRRPAASS